MRKYLEVHLISTNLTFIGIFPHRLLPNNQKQIKGQKTLDCCAGCRDLIDFALRHFLMVSYTI